MQNNTEEREETEKIEEIEDKYLIKYLEQLSEIEKKTIDVAKTILGSSFNINRSLGFIDWKKMYK
jgi:hypothetical protein